MSDKQDCFQWTEEESQRILQVNGTNEETLRQDVENIKKWIKTQLHFPEMPTDDAIKKFFLLNKLSIERTKQKLDAYYSIRNVVPELFNKHPLSKEMMDIATNKVFVVGVPNLTPDLDRVMLMGYLGNDVVDMTLNFAHVINVTELRLLTDRMNADVVILDLTKTNFRSMTTLSPSLLAKFIAIVEKVFSARLKAIHIVHGLPKLDNFIRMGKSFLREKHRKRLYVHKDYNSLHKMIDKSMLPKELGGQNVSIREIIKITDEKVH